MTCQRCKGLMVQDRAYDLLSSGIHCEVWRCVCCGNMHDTRILRNRIHSTSPVEQSARVSHLPKRRAA